jgi:membrane protease subunit (stomatin/prohibitin family)
MAILDLLEFFDNGGEIIVSRIPFEGSGEIRLGSQLVVQESQTAFFYRDGRMLDHFGPGRHTLHTQNLPLLGSIIGAPFGGHSPFRAYVYFLSLKTFPGLGWGTPTPILFRDTDFRMVTLRAHGSFAIRISQSRTFLQTMVGTKGLETTFAIQEYLRTIIVSRFNEVLGGTLKSILDLPVHYQRIALEVKERVRDDFDQYGIQLVDLVVEAITPPKEVQEMLNRATGVAAQDADKYRAITAADAMRDMARNPGGGGDAAGMGLGLGAGLVMAQQMGQSFAQPQAQAHQPAATDLPRPGVSTEEIRTKLKDLKSLKDDGLISDADFEEQKRRLLALL